MPSTSPLHTTVLAVHRDDTHRFSKPAVAQITLLPGLGVEGDAHCGRTVQHRSRVKANPHQPNLRQVHLVTASLFEHVAALGFRVAPGQLGENITLASAPGLQWDELIALPVGTRVVFGPYVSETSGAVDDAPHAVLELTGLRNPCVQIEQFQPGLLAAMLAHDPQGALVRKAGVMAVVLAGGVVAPGTSVTFELPPLPHRPMERV
jgi:MOSC domain-containing protein YiiM